MAAFGRKSDWQQRYARLYSIHLPTTLASNMPQEYRRVSFMNNTVSPYTSLLARSWQDRVRREKDRTANSTEDECVTELTTLEETTSKIESDASSKIADLADGAAPSLLQLLRSRRQSTVSTQMLDLSTREEDDESVPVRSELYSGMRALDTERSASRSRTSTRRPDMHHTAALSTLLLPYSMKKGESYRKPTVEQVPLPPPPARWSLRRSVCPACSQKWKDRSSINNVKHSGLKRNSSNPYTRSVIAPARLQTAIMSQYSPRTVPAAMDSGSSAMLSGAGAAAWQLTRARRSRPLSPVLRARAPSPHAASAAATASAAAAPSPLEASRVALLTRADINRRVNSFLTGTIC